VVLLLLSFLIIVFVALCFMDEIVGLLLVIDAVVYYVLDYDMHSIFCYCDFYVA